MTTATGDIKLCSTFRAKHTYDKKAQWADHTVA